MWSKAICSLLLGVLGLHAAKGQPADTLTMHFASNESNLLPEDRTTLDHWYTRYSSQLLSIQLIGYCDSVGANKYNDSLSLQRVAVVKGYLESKGIADTLFTMLRAFGKRKPLNDNGDEEKRSQNRRVTIVGRLKPASTGLQEALRDTAAATGKNFVLNIVFYRDVRYPMPVSMPVLQELLAAMKKHPGLKIEIQGYVCCMPNNMDGYDIETHQYNLSVTRAKYVFDYLAHLGVDSSRMTYKGFGSSRKIYPKELDEFQRTANRRVELKVVGW